ncbi:DUF6538 domain-containing protein [Novosphingobium sp. 11B]
MRLRGGRFYVRRHVPCDLREPLSRVELWRSLKTDSLQTALRRMPAVMAGIEAEFERVRAGVGATTDDAMLRFDTVAQPIVENVRVSTEIPASIPSSDVTLVEAYQRYVDEERSSISRSAMSEASRNANSYQNASLKGFSLNSRTRHGRNAWRQSVRRSANAKQPPESERSRRVDRASDRSGPSLTSLEWRERVSSVRRKCSRTEIE